MYLPLPAVSASIYLLNFKGSHRPGQRQEHLATRLLRTGGQFSYPTLSFYLLYVSSLFFSFIRYL